jgi:hypothetical protein
MGRFSKKNPPYVPEIYLRGSPYFRKHLAARSANYNPADRRFGRDPLRAAEALTVTWR